MNAGPYTDAERARLEAQGKKIGFWIAVAVFVGLPLLFGLIAWISGSGSDNTSDFDEGEARVMCEDFVRDRLKSPGTASFIRPSVTSAGIETWRVDGSVDAENSFGGTVRVDYQCTVRGEDGTATLIDLQHQER